MADRKAEPARATVNSTADVDLRDPISYTASIEWIRRNVVLKETTKESLLRLNVLLPAASVTLFMDPAHHYILGFQGKDKIYLLDDPASNRFKDQLESQIKGVQVTILTGLSSQHGPQGLGTFQPTKNGHVGVIFRREDLECVARLSTYSRKTESTYEHLRRPLSLLVCMIAESARIPIMQRDFTNMYYGHNVVADEAIRSYVDAKFLISTAIRVFPRYPPNLAVEKLQKRAAELDSLLTAIQAAAETRERIKIVSVLLGRGTPAGGGRVTEQIRRFREMCAELQPANTPETITQIISTCKSGSAVRAAKQGVEGPEIAKVFQARA